MVKPITPAIARRDVKVILALLFIMFILVIIDRYYYDIPAEWGKTELCNTGVTLLLGFVIGAGAMYGWPEVWSKDNEPKLVYEEEE